MAKKTRKTTTARTGTKNAGKPVTSKTVRAAETAAGAPSAEELDIRDRLKSGPRRPAGPPLAGDTLEKAAMKALRDEVVPEATDPKNRRSKR
jgi:hypothetical protein